ncbi:MAG TPA: PHP domain-containing protein [Phnomibacter sp.]|nr:PHP domain-containing protein [Phnomibacter sp.]
MDNFQIADLFSLLAKLMDIHGENSFKTKTYANAAFQIEKLNTPLAQMDTAQIAAQRGIGQSVAQKVEEIIATGKLAVLDNLISQTPPGVLEMLRIKGLGPKKIHTVWKEMEIESVGELLYACHENRLTLYKGFGQKTQDNIQEAITFYLSQQGLYLYQQAEQAALPVLSMLATTFGEDKVSLTGKLRQQAIIIDKINILVAATVSEVATCLNEAGSLVATHTTATTLQYYEEGQLPLEIITCTPTLFGSALLATTGPDAFTDNFPMPDWQTTTAATEAELFAAANLPMIHPSLRHHADIYQKAKQGLPAVIETKDIRGIIHTHSTWSDGTHTIEQMAHAAINQGFEYLVISDHSKSATYAQGLSAERVIAQHAEIDALNKQLAPFKIFKSIESDILGDGSLDYEVDILSRFDLVIASIHSNLKMNEEKAMMRLLTAIVNPYTTVLGHPTGRLLLSRNGYPVNHEQLIEACVAHKVAIELNAHPRRLDIDYAWLPKATEAGAIISINPDAHFIEGFADIRYGVLAAQKGMLTAAQNLSSLPLAAFEAYLQQVKASKGTHA